MKYMTGLDRRAFVRGGACLLASIAVGFPAYLTNRDAWSDNGRGAGDLLEELRIAMPRANDARGLGLACVGVVPGITKGPARTAGSRLGALDIEGRLTSALGADVRSLQRSELRSRIANRTREDFRCGRTVCVEGWILAQTETLLYAALAVA